MENTSLIYNCRLYSAPQKRAWIFSQKGKIRAIGYGATPRRFSACQAINLQGAYLYPGFIDAHIHLHLIGEGFHKLNLRACRSKAELLEAVKHRRKKIQPGEFLTGYGWDESRWLDQEKPTRQELDSAAGDIPVILARTDEHCSVVNSKFLAQYLKKFGALDPTGGRIERGNDGEMNGILLETAHNYAWEKLLPEPDEKTSREILLLGQRECIRHGITAAHDVAVSHRHRLCYEAAADDNSLKMFMSLAVWGEKAVKAALREGPSKLSIEKRVHVFGVKFFLDGTLGSRTALLDEPYADDPENRGEQIMKPEKLRKAVASAVEAKLQPLVHAIGNRATQMAVEIFSGVAKKRKTLRMRVEHAEVMEPSDIQRARDSGILLSVQPSHIISDRHWLMERLGKDRTHFAGPWRTMQNSGVKMCGGSDAPIDEISPIISMLDAVHRPRFHPEECLNRAEALQLYTANAAYAARQERNMGEIRVGQFANFTVLDRNFLKVPLVDARRSKVIATIIAGKAEYTKL